MWFRVATVSALLFALSEAVNVLVFVPGTTRYERRGLERIAQYLALKNHGVMTFRAVIIPEVKQLVMPKLHLVEELALRNVVHKNISEEVASAGNTIPWDSEYDTWRYQVPLWKAYANSCEIIMNSDLKQKIVRNKVELALVYAENLCHLALVHTLNIPYIYYDTRGFSEDTAIAAGVNLLPGEVPATTTNFPIAKLTLKEQAGNLMETIKAYLPYAQAELIRVLSPRWRILDGKVTKMFQDDPEIKKKVDFSNVNEVKRSAALYFVNSDPVLEHPARSIPSSVVYVGGAHMEYPRPLFPPWNDTIAEARDGVIVVSFGEFANGSAMPKQLTSALVHVFSVLSTYRVFWRIGTPTLPGFTEKEIPSNVNITQFLPQTDLLGDKNTRLLITHGGSDSIMEALHLGVPVLGIPLFGSNYNNLRKMEARGVAKILDKSEMNGPILLSTIRAILQNKYRNKAKLLSKIIKDRPVDAFETVIHWIETVARHPSVFARSDIPPIWKQFLKDFLSCELGCIIAVVVLISTLVMQWEFLKVLQGLIFRRKRVTFAQATNGQAHVMKDE